MAISRRSRCTVGLLAAPAGAQDADVAVVAPGAGQSGDGDPVGILGRGGRRGGERGGDTQRQRRSLAAYPRGRTPRERHRGVSHHSLTAYGRVALAAPATSSMPELSDSPELIRPARRPTADIATGGASSRAGAPVGWVCPSFGARARGPCRPSDAAWTSTGRTSWPQPRRDVMPRRCSERLARLGEEDVDDHHQGLVRSDRAAWGCRRGSRRRAGSPAARGCRRSGRSAP